ncbi:MAG: hypothetical protein NTZ48_00425 [Candidatus Omnitrophica bacterium]|nr:hypothetical protein [Candidatus Omnitrophota bacterium]
MRRIFGTLLILSFVFIFISCGKARTETKNDDNLGAKSAVAEEGNMDKVNKREYVEGEILVKFKPEVNTENIQEIVEKEYDCEIIDIIKGIDVYRLKIPADKKVPEILELLNKDERVKYAEPNTISDGKQI